MLEVDDCTGETNGVILGNKMDENDGSDDVPPIENGGVVMTVEDTTNIETVT